MQAKPWSFAHIIQKCQGVSSIKVQRKQISQAAVAPLGEQKAMGHVQKNVLFGKYRFLRFIPESFFPRLLFFLDVNSSNFTNIALCFYFYFFCRSVSIFKAHRFKFQVFDSFLAYLYVSYVYSLPILCSKI